MKIDFGLLEALAETQRYPALMARLAGVGRANEQVQWQVSELLADVLQPALPAGTPAELFAEMLEAGEVAAAQKLFEVGGFERSERTQIARRALVLRQELDQVEREVMGLCLLLKDARDPQVVASLARVDAVLQDEAQRAGRPGWVIRTLQAEQRRLKEGIARIHQEISAQKRQLEADLKGTQNRDLSVALERLDQLLQSQESLPAAQHMLGLARRAAAGNLHRDDLQILHRTNVESTRFVRPWTDFERDEIASAASIAELLGAPEVRLVSLSPEARTHALELFQTLSLQGHKLDTQAAAAQLREFLNLGVDFKQTWRRESGAIYSFCFAAPRVPAFRAGRFQGGLQLVIPRSADPSTFTSLLEHVPEQSFAIFYYPGKLEQNLSARYRFNPKLVFFDNLDLLRLCEVLDGQRGAAFQQVILPRAPFGQVKPWQAGGPVSVEMFRGRQAIIDQLKRPRGGTVLFSGRMMGKSSILERIYMDIEEDRRQPKHRAIKISNTGEDLFRPLVENLANLLDAKSARNFKRRREELQLSAAMTPRERNDCRRKRLDLIRKAVSQVLADPEARLYLLIDEADKFAADDARLEREFSLTWLLRDLEFERDERLRVVFAGFQDIHDQVISQNGAFANWYGMVQLGSLEEADADALIEEPFADFGFAFSSPVGVTRIKEFTGNHPLLIQEVCERLMDRMCARRADAPQDELITIEAGDVEVVCRDDQLRDRLRQVLSHNLDEYRRLKLMVYLILNSCSVGVGGPLKLEEFTLDGLKAALIDWYGEDFNEYFGEKNIGALLARLKALGLLKSRGETYQFVNRTFARILLEEPAFEQELAGLLAWVTNPDIGQSRRFVTLPNEHLERVVHNRQPGAGAPGDVRQNMLFVGLPGTGVEHIADQLFDQRSDTPQGSYLISAKGCTRLTQLQERLKKKLKERRTTLTLADIVVKYQLQTLVVSDADELAASGELAGLARDLNLRDRRVFAFGGAPLARAYVRQLLTCDFDVIYLERLRPQDIKAWGSERPYEKEGNVVIFDDNTARELRRVTGGYLPLIYRFAEFVRKELQNALEYLPAQKDVDNFEAQMGAALIEQALLSTLTGDERSALQALYAYAAREKAWELDAEWVREVVMPSLEQQTGLSVSELHDMLEIFEMLDLISVSNADGLRGVILDAEGPLARVFLAEGQ